MIQAAAHDFKEIDQKVDQETSKINIFDWVASMLAAGMLWALYERANKPVATGLAALALAHIDRDHVYGRRKPSGALAAIDGIGEILPFGRSQREVLDLSVANAGMYLQKISDDVKSEIRKVLIDSQMSGMGPKEIESRLRDSFSKVDRDWRKIAVTESAAMSVNGYLLKQEPGQLVVIQSAVDCCDWCRSMLHGKVFTTLQSEPKDSAQRSDSLWPGKNNVGRSRHKNVRGGEARDADKLWAPCCPLHPHCRCRPVAYDPRFQEVGPDGYLRLKGKS